MVITLSQRIPLQNYLIGDLVGAGCIQKLTQRNAEQHVRATIAKKWTVILFSRLGYHAFAHHFIFSKVFLSCGKDETYSSNWA